jgi:hypothetical protein
LYYEIFLYINKIENPNNNDNMHTRISDGSSNGVAFLQEKFNKPGSYEPAGDTYGMVGAGD